MSAGVFRRGALAAALVLCAATPAAQDLAWERVGDLRGNSSGAEWNDGFLWVDMTLGLHRIAEPYGPDQVWELVYEGVATRDPVFALSPDTLLTYSGAIARSVDGGATFVDTGGRAESRPVEITVGPHAGRLVAGDVTGTDGFGYAQLSDDRGATWTPVFGPPPDSDLTARYLHLVETGPRAGRLVAAGFWA